MGRAASKPASIYDVHPGIGMVQKWIAVLPAKSGRSLDGWLKLVKTAGG